ncbi:hypothetical protein T4B_11861 [Trichinella pseudospiralis]|uniref:Uncharacterized protein n=1 Tax=Trichinella pseudospiralis TaxID=6337 RepID=A0A0V1HCC7_TRIPS|nr:hypothetical protein T4B_11861 [Trichinella pseudospiralis]
MKKRGTGLHLRYDFHEKQNAQLADLMEHKFKRLSIQHERLIGNWLMTYAFLLVTQFLSPISRISYGF